MDSRDKSRSHLPVEAPFKAGGMLVVKVRYRQMKKA